MIVLWIPQFTVTEFYESEISQGSFEFCICGVKVRTVSNSLKILLMINFSPLAGLHLTTQRNILFSSGFFLPEVLFVQKANVRETDAKNRF